MAVRDRQRGDRAALAEYVEARVRAGVIEQGTGDLLRSLGLGSRMDREGFVHEGVTISNTRSPFRVDFMSLVDRVVMVYGQTEIQKDLYDSATGAGWPIVFEAEGVQLHDLTTDRPSVSYAVHGEQFVVDADFIAGCDGFHGVTRHAIPSNVRHEFERLYPFGWMGVLSETPPVSRHENSTKETNMTTQFTTKRVSQTLIIILTRHLLRGDTDTGGCAKARSNGGEEAISSGRPPWA